MQAIEEWIGRTEERVDTLHAAAARALNATLDRDSASPAVGDVLPPLWHWLYFLPDERQSELGPDGHGRRGGFLPPVALPRRMWAGGRFSWMHPLRVGDTVTRTSTITSVQRKSGRSGELVFVTVRHAFSTRAYLCLTEDHDIVYRDEPRSGGQATMPVVAPVRGAWERTVLTDAVMLFRYSALTFNGHRIHYDRSYVTEVEKYPGLIVHGPLQATLMLDLVQRHAPERKLRSFEFRALRPAFDGRALRLGAEPTADGGVKLWVADAHGFVTMQASATLA